MLEAEIVDDRVTITGARPQPFWGASGVALFVRLLLLAVAVVAAALFAVVVAAVAVVALGAMLILGSWHRRRWRKSMGV